MNRLKHIKLEYLENEWFVCNEKSGMKMMAFGCVDEKLNRFGTSCLALLVSNG